MALDVSEIAEVTSESPFPAGALAVAFADGASRGNPGDASYGCVYTTEDGEPLCGEALKLGKTTNNVAEYRGCIAALSRLKSWGVTRGVVRLDSELVVKQVNGLYKVRQEHLKPLVAQARELRDGFVQMRIEHVRRAKNALADGLANAVLDGKR
ncbi:ribonuclease H [bacterium]|nr:MAG: ribonuclease H [bacterium]